MAWVKCKLDAPKWVKPCAICGKPVTSKFYYDPQNKGIAHEECVEKSIEKFMKESEPEETTQEKPKATKEAETYILIIREFVEQINGSIETLLNVSKEILKNIEELKNMTKERNDMLKKRMEEEKEK